MPQMAPLSWLSLMIFFISIFFIFNNMNYYVFLSDFILKKIMEMKKMKTNWKW